MAKVIKKLKIKKPDETMSDYIPIGAEASNVNVDGESVEVKLNKTPYYYDSVADMKADETLKAGDMAITLGYYEVNDGGNSEYKIVSGAYTDDGGSYHELDNGLFAELIVKNEIINIKQFGCKSNNESYDNFAIINKIIQFLYNTFGEGKIFIPKGIFYGRPDLNYIYVRPNITFFGDGNESVIKVSSSTEKYQQIFGNYNGVASEPIAHNVIFDNFCIDGNLTNNIQTSPANSNQRIEINSTRNAENVMIKNMTFYTNGTWCIAIHGNNNIIRDNVVWFYQPHTSTFYDVSTFYIEGDNCLVENNKINVIEDNNLLTPNTAVELHGSYNIVKNNDLKNYSCGIITIPHQVDWVGINGNYNRIEDNNIEAISIGISIWAGTKGTECKGNIYTRNNILLTTAGTNSSKRGIAVTYSVNPNLVTISDIIISNNIITYKYRNKNRDVSTGDHAIVSMNVTNINDLTIENNVINNCGGHGILLGIYASGEYAEKYIKNVKICKNIFHNVFLPIRLLDNCRNTIITNNDFIQDTIYETAEDNMTQIISHYDKKGKEWTLKNNNIRTPLNLKPFYPTINMHSFGLGVSFRISDGIYLERNESNNIIPYYDTRDTNVHSYTINNESIFSEDGTLKRALYYTPGTLKTSSGEDVTITEWISNRCVRVNDASNIYPEQFIQLDNTKFAKSYTYIGAVVNDLIYLPDGSLSNTFALKDGIQPEDVIGSILTFSKYTKTL